MAQQVTFINIESDYENVITVTTGAVTEEDVREEANSYDFDGNIKSSYYCYNIGEGESGADEFFTEDELRDAFEADLLHNEDFSVFCNSRGYVADVYEQGMFNFYID